MTKRNLFTGIIITLILALQSTAYAESNQLSGNVTATSTYIWRGLPQTSEAAMQGGAQLDTGNVYFGGWTSTVLGGSEVDLYGGYKGKADVFNYDAGAILYIYPQEPDGKDYNFAEFYVDVSRDFYGAKLSLSSDAGTYLEAYATFPLQDWHLGLHAGRYAIDESYDGFKDAGVTDDYFDLRVGVGKDVGGFDVEFALSDTNLSGPLGDFRTTISASKNFTP
jgi:uncharacterized protein (TIGR02001 family)